MLTGLQGCLSALLAIGVEHAVGDRLKLKLVVESLGPGRGEESQLAEPVTNADTFTGSILDGHLDEMAAHPPALALRVHHEVRYVQDVRTVADQAKQAYKSPILPGGNNETGGLQRAPIAVESTVGTETDGRGQGLHLIGGHRV
jgi:hypothetical protein